jgi:uncharacterized protein (TIGR02996 family)
VKKIDARLAKILADPDDDQLRLVYADELIERDDPRGELIQIQCAEEGGTGGRPGDDWRALRKKADRIIAKHQKAWLAPFRESIYRWAFERGFLGHVWGDPADFPKKAEVLFAMEPVETVHITGMKPAAAGKLGAKDVWRPVRVLDLSSQRMKGPEVTAFFAKARFEKLRELQIWRNPMGDDGAKSIAGAGLPPLRDLGVETCGLGPAGAEAIARVKLVERLGIGGNAIGDRGAKALAHLKVTHLDAASCEIGSEGAAALAAMAALVELDLRSNGVGDDGVIELARSKTIKKLDLGSNPLGAAGVKALLAMKQLEELSVWGEGLDEKSIAAVKKRFGEYAAR